jgi:peroxiredoxin
MTDLEPGTSFPDISLPDHTGTELSLSTIADEHPLVLCFVRGWWCPKEQVRLRGLVEMQEEIQREYGRLAVVTVDEPYVNGALRAGLGASFPFLSDEDRAVAEELDLLELTDEWHRPYLPMTYVLDSLLHIHAVWCGFWYWGNPTPDELRLALREIAAGAAELRAAAAVAGTRLRARRCRSPGGRDLDQGVERRPRALARSVARRSARGGQGARAVERRRQAVARALGRAGERPRRHPCPQAGQDRLAEARRASRHRAADRALAPPS